MVHDMQAAIKPKEIPCSSILFFKYVRKWAYNTSRIINGQIINKRFPLGPKSNKEYI
jgi:hypothetical protein